MDGWQPILESNVTWKIDHTGVMELRWPNHSGDGAVWLQKRTGKLMTGDNADIILKHNPEIREFLIGLLRMLS